MGKRTYISFYFFIITLSVTITSCELLSPPSEEKPVPQYELNIYNLESKQSKTLGKFSGGRFTKEGNIVTDNDYGTLHLIVEEGTDNIIDRSAFDHSISILKDKVVYRKVSERVTAIYIMNTDGTGLTKVRSDTIQYGYPNISPDGKKIVFLSNGDLAVMNSDGNNLLILKEKPDSVEYSKPTFYIDNESVFFIERDQTKGTSFLKMIHLPDMEETNVIPRGALWLYDISINGLILYTVVENFTSNMRVYNKEDNTFAKVGAANNAYFSSDGLKIIYDYNNIIYLCNTDGTDKQEMLTVNDDYITNIDISVNKKNILYGKVNYTKN